MKIRKWEVVTGIFTRPSINIDNDWIHLNKLEDANLIAAAPELLEALQICLPLAERLTRNFGCDPAKDQDFIDARKAIAKAQG